MTEDTWFKVLTEKTKAIMTSRRKFPITPKRRINIWAKGEKIDQVREHHIWGLIFETRMNKLEYKSQGIK
jgi:hypothetical protein